MSGGKQEHIVRAFDQDLDRLSEMIVRMGGLAEAQLAEATEALARRDSELASRVVRGDSELDRLEMQLADAAVQMLALRQPMASDLREVVSALKISADLERIGDYAANVAKRVIALNQLPAVQPAHSLPRMAHLARAGIKRVLDAYVARDAALALEVWEADAEIDETYTSLFRETLTYMMEDPRNITPCTHLLFMAKNIERIGDHATNIAETIHYLATGERLTAGRPKGDASSYEVATASPPGEARR